MRSLSKNLSFIVLCVLFIAVDGYADERSFFNFGFKFGHTFGDDGGFTVGTEISYTTLSEKFGRGILIDYDVCQGRSKLHLGAELMAAGVGVSIGPTLAGQYNQTVWGYTATFFWGFVSLSLLQLYIYPEFAVS